MERVQEKMSSASRDTSSELDGFEYSPGSIKLVRGRGGQGHSPTPGGLSLRVLIVSALLGTSTFSCCLMLLIIELTAGSDGDGRAAARVAAVIVILVAMALCFVLGWWISSAVVRPMGSVAKLVELFNEPDVTRRSEELGKLRAGRRSWIRDVGELQETCYRLSRGVEMFMRYVPDAVVRSIVRGDETAMRLHVFRRKVTIMFSDIKDFTNISETLSQEDLLYVLTRYLSIMTKVVESYQGVVAEILGDGLLVYWNTPDDVPGHEMKACAAAMAQQQVLNPLNAELQRLKMPSISIRIGLHTGRVLTGTIGSETKMKFGCLGDPVNLAARLEGLCKVYGVSVLCSGETFDGLPKDSGFLCRQLDLVQVKGKRQATRIYEVVGVANCEACLEHDAVRSTAQTAMRMSTAALRDSNVLQVNPIRRQRRSSFFQMGTYNLEQLAEATATDVPAGDDCNHIDDCNHVTHRSSTDSNTSKLWDAVTPEAAKHVELYEQALRKYQEAHLVEAQSLLKTFLEQLPEDRAANMLLERVSRYVSPDGDDIIGLTPAELAAWTGVTVINEK